MKLVCVMNLLLLLLVAPFQLECFEALEGTILGFMSFMFHLARVADLLNAVLCLQLLCGPAQVHLPQLVQQLLQQGPVQHCSSSSSSSS